MTPLPPGTSWRAELGALVRLALPLCAVQLGARLMGFVDIAIVGRLGGDALAAVGVGNAVYFAFGVTGIGVVMGSDPLISQALGAGREGRARNLLWQAVWVALATAVVLAVPLLFAGELFSLFQIEEEVSREARTYLLLRLLGLVPFLWMFCCRAYLQALGRTWPMLLAVVVGNIVNVVLTTALVFGFSVDTAFVSVTIIPRLGVAGSAIATVLGQVLQLLICVLGLPPGPRPTRRRPRGEDFRSILRVGLPSGLHLGAEVGVFALTGLLAGSLGTLSLAAHQIALTLCSMSFVVCIGLANAGSVRVGRAIGAGDSERARRAGLLAVGCSVAVMGSSASLLMTIPEQLAAILTDQADVIVRSATLLGIAALLQIPDGIQGVGAGILRGAGDTRSAFVVNLIGHYGVGLPLAILLAFGFGWGVEGLWLALTGGLTAVAVALLGRFLRISSGTMARLE